MECGKPKPQKTLQQHTQAAHFSSHIHTLYTHIFTLQSSCVKGAFTTLATFVEHKVTKSAAHTLTWSVTGLL